MFEILYEVRLRLNYAFKLDLIKKIQFLQETFHDVILRSDLSLYPHFYSLSVFLSLSLYFSLSLISFIPLPLSFLLSVFPSFFTSFHFSISFFLSSFLSFPLSRSLSLEPLSLSLSLSLSLFFSLPLSPFVPVSISHNL